MRYLKFQYSTSNSIQYHKFLRINRNTRTFKWTYTYNSTSTLSGPQSFMLTESRHPTMHHHDWWSVALHISGKIKTDHTAMETRRRRNESRKYTAHLQGTTRPATFISAVLCTRPTVYTNFRQIWNVTRTRNTATACHIFVKVWNLEGGMHADFDKRQVTESDGQPMPASSPVVTTRTAFYDICKPSILPTRRIQGVSRL